MKLSIGITIILVQIAMALGGDIWQAYPIKFMEVPDLKVYQPVGAKAVTLNPPESRFESAMTQWDIRDGWTLAAKEGREGSGALCGRTVDGKPQEIASRVLPVTGGRWYRFSIWARSIGGDENQMPKADIRVDSAPGSYDNYFWKTVETKEGWHRLQWEGRIPGDIYKITLELFPPAKGVGYWDDLEIEELPGKWTASVIRPYRRTITTKDGRVLLNSYLDGQLVPSAPKTTDTLECVIRIVQNAKEIRRVCAAVNEDRIAADLGVLSTGAATLELTLINRSTEQILAACREEIFVAEPGQQFTPIDEYGRLLVNGKPFFSIGVYFNSHEHMEPGCAVLQHADLQRLADAGFNTVYDYSLLSQKLEGSTATGAALIREMLDTYHQHGLRVIFSIKDIYPEGIHGTFGWPRNGWLASYGDDADAVAAAVVNEFKNHPAILGWGIDDEIFPVDIPLLRKRAELIHKLDPARVVFGVQYQMTDLPYYAGSLDMLGIDPYPLNTAGNQNQYYVRYAVKMIQKTEGTALGQPFWGVPQGSNLGVYHSKTREGMLAKYRYPSEQEVRSMALLMVIGGSKAVTWYAYFDYRRGMTMPDFESQWPNLGNQGKLFSELGDAILNSEEAGPEIKLTIEKGDAAARSFRFPQHATALHSGKAVVMIAGIGPDISQAVLELPKHIKWASRFGKIKEIAPGRYRFIGNNVDSDILLEE